MRVAFVSSTTVYHEDGTTEANDRLRWLARALSERGHDVIVFTTQWWQGTPRSRVREGVTYRSLAPEPGAWRTFYCRLPAAIARWSPDVVHARAVPPGGALAARAGARLVRVPLVVEWYGEAVDDPGPNHGRALRGADVVVTPSRLVRTRAMELEVPEDSVHVVPNGIDVDLIEETPILDKGGIVYARRLDEGANLESVLLGLAELRQMDWSATIIGDGPAREGYEQQARDLRIDDRVEFVGACSRETRIGIYRGAHVFCQTATHCVFPTEMLWALACGCAGIVEYHTDSSAHEIVEGWPRGFRTTSESELAQAIRDAADLEDLDFDPDFAEYDDDEVLETYLECYRTVRE